MTDDMLHDVIDPSAATTTPAPTAPARPSRPRLGEELPIFCERCGYALHGLPQVQCDHCAIRQFHCPECGHHQAINTLRPAVMNIVGRVRAFALTIITIVKIAFFLGMLIGGWGIGLGSSYRYTPDAFEAPPQGSTQTSYTQIAPSQHPTDVQIEHIIPIGIFALMFGVVGRMLLLRWRFGWLVGIVLTTLMGGMYTLGAYTEWSTSWREPFPYASPFTRTYLGLLGYWMGLTLAGASLVWPAWVLLVRAFLPARASNALLDWQRAMSNPTKTDSNRAAAQLAADAPVGSQRVSD